MNRIAALLLTCLLTLGLGRLAFPKDPVYEGKQPAPPLDAKQGQKLQTATFALG